MNSPDAVEIVARAFSAIEKDDWAAVADLTAPEIIDRFRAHEIAFLLAWAEHMATRDETGATGFGSKAVVDPDMLARYGEVKLERISGAPTIAQLAGIDPRSFFAHWLRIGHEFNRRFRHVQQDVRRQIIGAVPEGDRLVHVVYRGIARIPVIRVQVMPVRQENGRWLLLQNDDVLQTPHLLLFDHRELGPAAQAS